MLEQNLKYDFPKGNSDPFDQLFRGNFFVYANAYSNLSNNIKDFSIDILGQNIPMGYKTIIILNREVLVISGNLKKQWAQEDFDKDKKYFMTTDKTISFYRQDWGRNIETNVLYKPFTADASLNSSIWNNLKDGIEYAKLKSIEHDCSILISEIIESISWH